MANTVFKVENGLLVIGDANVAGTLSVGGNLNVSGNLVYTGSAVGNIVPVNNTYSLGTSGFRWALYATSIDVGNAATFSNTLTVTGNATFSNVVTVSNNITISGVTNTASLNVGANVNLSTTQINVGNSSVNTVVSSTGIDTDGTLAVLGATTLSNSFSVSGNAVFSTTANVAGALRTGNTTVNGSLITNTFLTVGTVANTPNLNVTDTGTIKSIVGNTIVLDVGPGNTFIVTGNTTYRNVVLTTNLTTITGNVNIDSGVLFVDGVNNRVGISNTTPDASLTITGTANVSGGVVLGGVLTVSGLTSTQNLVVGGASANISSNVNITGASHSITGNSNFDSGVLFVDGFNNRVGISNTTPDASLTITGTANVSGAVRFGSTLAAVGAATLSNTISVTGSATLSNTLNVSGAANLQSSANVAGTLGVLGATTLSANLSVSSNASFTANVSITGDLAIKTYNESLSNVTPSSSAVTLDLSTSGVFNVSINQNITFTFSNPPAAGKLGSFVLITLNDATPGRTITWPASVKWPGGASNIPPRTTTASALDIWTFFTYDGGTTYVGSLAAKDVKA